MALYIHSETEILYQKNVKRQSLGVRIYPLGLELCETLLEVNGASYF